MCVPLLKSILIVMEADRARRDFVKRRMTLLSMEIGTKELQLEELRGTIEFLRKERSDAMVLLRVGDSKNFSEPAAFIDQLLIPWNVEDALTPWGPELVIEFFYIDQVGFEGFIVSVANYIEKNCHEHAPKMATLLGRLVYERLLPVGFLGINRNYWAAVVMRMEPNRDTVCALLELIGDAEYEIERLHYDPHELVDNFSSGFTFTHTIVDKSRPRETTELDVPLEELAAYIARYIDPRVIYAMLSDRERGTALKRVAIIHRAVLDAIVESVNRSDPSDIMLSKCWFSALNCVKSAVANLDLYQTLIIDRVSDNLTRMYEASLGRGIFMQSFVRDTKLQSVFEDLRRDFIERLLS